MSTVLTEVSTFDTVTVPTTTDPFSLAGIVAALQNLANRGRYLKDNALIGGETFAGPKTINCGAQALTITGGAGATNLTRTTGTITVSGAGGATVTSAAAAALTATGTGTAAVSTAGGNASVTAGGAGNASVAAAGTGAASLSTASGNVSVSAGGTGTAGLSTASGNVAVTAGGAGNVAVTAGGNITFAPAGTWGGAAGRLALTGAGYPTRAAQAFANVGVRWMAQNDVSSNTFFYNVGAPGELVHGVTTQETTTIELVLSPACTYTSLTVRFRGADPAVLPTTNDAFRVFEQDAETSTPLSALVVDPTATIATYKTYHDVAVALTSTLRPVAGRRYFLTWRTAGGMGSPATYFASLVKVGATGATDRFGVGNEPTA